MESKIKIKLSLYGIISAISYIVLILTPNPGVSVLLFIIVQFASIYMIIKNNLDINIKGILLMVPIFILSINRFISSNRMWSTTNFLAIVLLYSVMILLLNKSLFLKNLNIENIFRIIFNIFEPIANFGVPIKWMSFKSNNDKNVIIKRVIIGIAISTPCVLFLTLMLSSADMIFNNNVLSFNKWLSSLFNFDYIFKLIMGTFAGLYLFGHLYNVLVDKDKNIVKLDSLNKITIKQINGDLIVLNILLISILLIYSIFIAIQFKYLFSSGELPFGLNYAQYARRGFFELVFLSVSNIGLILLITYLLKDKIYSDKTKWAMVTKGMMIYLCAVTGILLVSSYYRMSLYDSAYGFTRLRILVYLFLLFESFGLLATLFYILKHNFNILLVYASIGLIYYLTLNIIPIDGVIAKRNIDMYLSGKSGSVDINYLMTLSPDAAPEIFRLLDKDVEIITRVRASNYLSELQKRYSAMEYNWQSYNLSVEKNKNLLLQLELKGKA